MQATLDTTNAMPGTYNVSVTVFGYTTNTLSLTLADPTPQITSISPSHIDPGATLVSVTISGSGFGANATLDPSGVQISPAASGLTLNGIRSWSPNQITVTMTADASYSGIYGISVVSRGATGNGFVEAPQQGSEAQSNQGQVEVSSAAGLAAYMVVTDDNTGLCSGCSSTVNRLVTYRVMNSANANVGHAAICEDASVSNWNCTQQQPINNTQSCSGYPAMTAIDGTFTDEWSLKRDIYVPVGCGWDTVDVWKEPHISGAPTPFGTLTGYIHTDHIKINNVVSPARIPAGTRIYP